MKTDNIHHDIRVFGLEVITFPRGIKEAFDELVNKVPEGLNHSYNGLSHVDTEGHIIYYAAVNEYSPDEGGKPGYD